MTMRRTLSLLFATLFLGGTRAFASNPLEVPLPVEIEIFGMVIKFSHDVIVMCAVASIIIYVLCWLATRSLSKDKPSRAQGLLEIFVKAFDDLVTQAIGPNRGRKYLPYIGTLFLFIFTCNMMGLIPIGHHHVGAEHYEDYNGNGEFDPNEPFTQADDLNKNGVHDAGFPLPGFEEPTKNLNVPLAMAIFFVLILGHGSHIRIHGIVGYIKDYFSPGGVIGIPMFFLNVVGKVAEVVSISFRLFGNIFGGVVIISVVSGLLAYIVMPIGLFGFFGVFVGTVQAFVFTMLALTYIAMGAAEE